MHYKFRIELLLTQGVIQYIAGIIAAPIRINNYFDLRRYFMIFYQFVMVFKMESTSSEGSSIYDSIFFVKASKTVDK